MRRPDARTSELSVLSDAVSSACDDAMSGSASAVRPCR